jgi:ATP/maltotriose-dependent transcriptional regulator MalT
MAMLGLPSRTVRRARLEGHAERLCDYALTAVSAGAGFGKTTLLRAWAQQSAAERDVAWLALDEADTDLRTFLNALENALAAALGAATVAGPLLDAGREEPAALARALANELSAKTAQRAREAVIFFDDFHVVQAHAAVRELVGGLLRTLPPRVHVVIAGRLPLDFSPVVKLRADGLVADFMQNDLRFTQDEALALLEGSGLEAAQRETFSELVRRADGWAMALRLSAQAAPVIEERSPRRRAATRRPLFAYLAEEVLRAQPPDVRTLLLDCAAFKTLDASMLECVLDVCDGGATLEALLSRNLYLEPAGDGYAFHELFREFLIATQTRERPERLREIRIRYARLLEERGDLISSVAQYLEAGEFVAATDHVAHVQFAIKYGENAERIDALLRQIPDGLKRDRPRLLQFEATAKRRLLDFDGAAATFARGRACALEIDDFATACSCAIEEGMLADDLRAGGHGTFERSVALFTEACEYARRCGPKSPAYEKTASLALGLAYSARFEYQRARPLLERAEALQRASPARPDVLTTIAVIHGWQGDWRRALEYAELSEDFLRGGGDAHLAGGSLKTQARAHCHLRDDVRRALALAQRAVEAELASNELDDLPEAYVVLARAYLAQTSPATERAHAALDEAQARLQRRPNRATAFDLQAVRCEAYLADGALAAARREMCAARAQAEANRDPHESAVASFLEGLVCNAEGQHQSAAERLASASAEFDRLHDAFYKGLCEIAALGALAHAGSLGEDAFLNALERLEGNEAALRCAPRTAAQLLAWSLRGGVACERAYSVLGEAMRAAPDELLALALDEEVPSAARVRAVRFLARERGDGERRPLLAKLARARDPEVAAAASTALRLLPREVAAPLALHVVGPLRIRIGEELLDERDARWTRKKAIEMLRVLALTEGAVPKSSMVAFLWPGRPSSAAETNLRVTLHSLRRALEPGVEGTGSYVDYDGQMLALRREAVAFIDAREAQIAFRQALLAHKRERFEESESLYARAIELLSGTPPEEDVAEWLTLHTENWRRMLLAALRASAELRLLAGGTHAAQAFIERALRLDPLDEESVSVALDVALAASDLERAKAIFVAYKKHLATELAATPGAELVAKYGAILKARSADRSADLTAREVEILTLIGRGRSNKQIAQELSLSPWTVSGHVARILRKLRVDSRAAAVAAAGGLLEA